jgi:hypothetical protein
MEDLTPFRVEDLTPFRVTPFRKDFCGAFAAGTARRMEPSRFSAWAEALACCDNAQNFISVANAWLTYYRCSEYGW